MARHLLFAAFTFTGVTAGTSGVYFFPTVAALEAVF